MLGLDLAPLSRLRHDMDEATADLIAQLCTRIGMIMEDASVVALTIGGRKPENFSADFAELEVAAARVTALVAAAKILLPTLPTVGAMPR
jgi:hypothetical protein